MKYRYLCIYCFCAIFLQSCLQKKGNDVFPDGTNISKWFSEVSKIKLNELGTQFNILDFGAVNDSTIVQTNSIQKAIDAAESQGGGVVIIPKGIYISGALFFKSKTHLYVSEGAILRGSNNIDDYPYLPSRIEGQSIDYFSALVNANGVDGFSISGKGTIDGNGLKYWEAFWERRKENPNCTNLEVSRPRLVFISNANNVQIQDVKLLNSGFWTSHYYKCNNIKILDLYIASPHKPVKAPSTDAIDLDICSNVLIKGCYMAVNDDAIALKGGKGPWADSDPNNGENTNIIIEDCEFGFCHAALTCGSESIHNKNIIFRNCYVNEAKRLLWLKMRPDTPQKYEFITLENIKGQAHSMIYVKPWTQFFNLKGKEEVPISYSENISLKNIELECEVFFDVEITEHDILSNFTFEDLKIEAKNSAINKELIGGFKLSNVVVNDKQID